MILDRMSGAISIDVDKTDRYIAFPRSPKSIVVYKLHLDAVPIDDKQNYLGNDIYPNPTTGTITVNIPYNFGRVITSALYDISGKLIKDFTQFDANVDKDKILFSLTGIQPGIYYLTITSKNNTLTYKVIYQR
ncbi:hypothetical protein MASR1M45_13110 [Candidatus Kapaibacterium sp.]